MPAETSAQARRDKSTWSGGNGVMDRISMLPEWLNTPFQEPVRAVKKVNKTSEQPRSSWATKMSRR